MQLIKISHLRDVDIKGKKFKLSGYIRKTTADPRFEEFKIEAIGEALCVQKVPVSEEAFQMELLPY